MHDYLHVYGRARLAFRPRRACSKGVKEPAALLAIDLYGDSCRRFQMETSPLDLFCALYCKLY